MLFVLGSRFTEPRAFDGLLESRSNRFLTQGDLLTFPEKKIVAGVAYTAEDFARAIEVLRSRLADIERFITAVVPLEKAVEGGFSELVNKKSKHNKILVQVGGD